MKPNLEPSETDFEFFSHLNHQQQKMLPDISHIVAKDLVASRTRLALIYILGSFLGYLISLSICAQCSVGFSGFAWQIASMIHEMPDPWCPFICGAIFGVAPFLVTLLVFSRFQHRYLLRNMAWLVISLPFLVSFCFMLFANLHDVVWDMKWLITAVATPYLCEVLASLMLRQNIWRETAAH